LNDKESILINLYEILSILIIIDAKKEGKNIRKTSNFEELYKWWVYID
jgi:hypothetical protein